MYSTFPSFIECNLILTVLICSFFISELGLATHFVPSRRVPTILEQLASLEQTTPSVIDSIIEDHSQEREPDEPPPALTGTRRQVLDSVFRHNSVEEIFSGLQNVIESHESAEIRAWAQDTLAALQLRSPTSLKVALLALRRGRTSTLHQSLQRELNIATAFCVSG